MITPEIRPAFSWVLLQFLCLIPLGIFISWFLRTRFDLIHERITPLVWLFGTFVIISVPVVAYFKIAGNVGEEALYTQYADFGERDRPNFILVIFDSLSAKDMSVYGYHRETTPFIRKWAKKAALFTGLKSASNYTTTTIPSLLTGKRVWTHHVFQPHLGNVSNLATENIIKVLKEHGYYTIANITILPIKRLGIVEQFDNISTQYEFLKDVNFIGNIEIFLYRHFGDKFFLYDWIVKTEFQRHFILGSFLTFLNRELGIGKKLVKVYDLEKIFNKFINDLEKGIPEPFFAYLHVAQPHFPYRVPFRQFYGLFGPTGKDEKLFNRDRYDEVIRSCDEQFKEFISKFEEMGRYKNTIIILSADHGEMFGKEYNGHGGYFLNEPQTSIPLIIKTDKSDKGLVINNLVEQIDIPATILDLAEIPIPEWMEGRSLVPLMQGKSPEPKPVFSMNFELNKSTEPITKGVVAIWEGNYKLIYYIEKDKSPLFNLKEDPEERNNLFDKEPEVGQRLLKLIQDNLKKANERFSKENG